jgi:hypothetical protein
MAACIYLADKPAWFHLGCSGVRIVQLLPCFHVHLYSWVQPVLNATRHACMDLITTCGVFAGVVQYVRHKIMLATQQGGVDGSTQHCKQMSAAGSAVQTCC